MKTKITSLFFLLASVFLLSGCATIFSKSVYPVTFNTNPPGAKIIIQDRDKTTVFEGTTPATVNLDASAGYFKKAKYTVTFMKPGYKIKIIPVYAKLDGWYFANLLIGGVIGMLIIDPASGAMYKLDPQYITETLIPETAYKQQKELRIYSIDNIPESWKEHLILVKK